MKHFIISLTLALAVFGCKAIPDNVESNGSGSKTNWLKTCESDLQCGDLAGASCVDHLCTKHCSDDFECRALGSHLQCQLSTDKVTACLPVCADGLGACATASPGAGNAATTAPVVSASSATMPSSPAPLEPSVPDAGTPTSTSASIPLSVATSSAPANPDSNAPVARPFAGPCVQEVDTDANGSVNDRTENEYDVQGRLVKTSLLDASNNERTTSYTYDTAGRILTSWQRTHLFALWVEEYTVQTFDANGNLLTSGKGNRNGSPFGSEPPELSDLTVLTYDPHNLKLTETIDTGKDGHIDEAWNHVRDAQGRLLYSTVQFLDDTMPRLASRNTYDDHGFLIKQELGDTSGTEFQVRDYENDAQGRHVKETIYWVGNATYVGPPYVNAVTYDDRGNELSSKSAPGEDGTYTEQHQSYDEQNRLISSEDVGTDHGQHYFVKYVYDTSGKQQLVYSKLDEKGETLRVLERTVDPAGHVLNETQRTNDKHADYRLTAQYNTYGQLLRQERDNDIDGTIDDLVITSVDSKGRVVTEETDTGADAVIEKRTTYSYACLD